MKESRFDVSLDISHDLVMELEHYLEKQDLVVLVDAEDKNLFVEKLCRSAVFTKTDKSLVIISTVNYTTKNEKHIYLTVSEDKMDCLHKLYRSYEVSDRLILISDSKNYGSVWNYVSNGVVSLDEAFEALLA